MKEYNLNIDTRILELLGPSLYTNIYYVLAELIANSYDADAENVYIIVNRDDIRVEDDGHGMSYESGDIRKYLHIARVSRDSEGD
jgi:HSP90 family molecular chaperone